MVKDFNITSADFPNICRVCLMTGELEGFIESGIFEIFKVISNVEILPNDELPKNVCGRCSNYLQEIERFAEQCRSSNTILKLIVENEEKVAKSEILDPSFKQTDYPLYSEDDDEDEKDSQGFDDPRDIKYEVSQDDLVKTEEDTSEDEKPLAKRRGRRRKDSSEPRPTKKGPLRKRRKRVKNELTESEDEKDSSNSIIPVCKACGGTFTSKTKLCSHYKENVSCRPKSFKLYKCETCEKEFSTIRRRNEHMNTHTGETPYICTYCGKGFQMYPAHFKHVYRHRLELGEVEFKPGYMENRVRLHLKCPLCPKIFASRSGFANHQLIHQGVKIQYKKRVKKEEEGPKRKNFLCNYCAKSFRTKVQLEGHIRGHTGERPFACAYCHKFFKTKAALKTHEMNHLGTTPQRFKCETCNKPFSLKAHYEVHKRTHTGEKPFSCNFCGKCFNYRGTWKIHLRIHTGETPYSCPVCGNRYHDKSSLNKHQKKKGHLGKAIKQEKLLIL